jgi:general L-amino acid transport system permease protein
MDVLLRAQIAFALFFAAYMAEAIRGGLQAIPRGQYAACESLGLTYWQAQRRIILPQALRTVIPSLVNIFIAAFKDTSLVVIISMIDLLGAANASTAEAKWWGLYIEPYLFVALIYLAMCSAMSAYSRGLERRLGIGER